MIVECEEMLWRPAWYRRRVMAQVAAVVKANPGFHRLIIVIPDGQGGRKAIEADDPVDPTAEPTIRALMTRIVRLAPPAVDDDPWAAV